MLLTPMRYKNYIWPHNPATYSISYERQVAVHKVPFGRYCMKLEQEPLPDYVRYSFEFRERFDGYGEELTEVSRNGAGSPVRRAETPEVRHTVASGDTLWGIARQYNVALEDLLAVNSGIKNPNFIRLGDQVVVPC